MIGEVLRSAQNDIARDEFRVTRKAAQHKVCKTMPTEYYVYIMTNKSRTLYTGVTNNLLWRVHEHKNKLVPGFTSKYNIQFLVYYEAGADIRAATAREKQI